MYKFQARWKEELVCSGPMGEFILDLPMGILTVCIPDKNVWDAKFPGFDFDDFKRQVEAWALNNNAKLEYGGSIY